VLYVEARRTAALFGQLRNAAIEFWKVSSEGDWNRVARARQRVNALSVPAQTAADELGVGFRFTSYPAPALGGPVYTVSVFQTICEPDAARGSVSKQMVIDVIDQCIGAANEIVERGRRRLRRPWNWPIMLVGFLLRIPTMIMDEAEVPVSAQEKFWAQAIKVLWALILLGTGAFFGLKPLILKAVSAVK